MTNPYPITPRQLDLDKLSGSSLKVTGNYPDIQLDVNFSGSPINLSASTVNYQGVSSYPSPMDHTHGIESSSNPGVNVSLLKTNSEGGITVQKLGVNLSGNPNYNLEIDSDLTFIGSQSIVTTSDSLTLSPASDLDLTPGGTARVRATNGVRLQSDNYASQTTGWGINYAGSGDFRYLYADELHAKTFIADLEQALAGGQIISKSVAPLYVDFIVPDYSTSASMIVESFLGFDTFKVFEDGDFVRVREFDRVSGSLNITNCWGQVYWISTDTIDKFQTYEFIRSTSPNGGLSASGTVVPKGVLVLDYGYAGNGIIESNAIDGAMAENSPYTQITNWTGHPAQKDTQLAVGDMVIGSTFVVGGSQIGEVVRTRTGNLKGIFNVSNEFGFYAGNGFRDTNSFLRISSCVVEAHNLSINLYDENAKTISLDPNNPSFAMGSTLPSSYTVGKGLWMGKDNDIYKFRIGDPRYNMLDWDGSNLYIWSNPTNYMKTSGLGMGFYLNNVERLSLSSNGNFTINDSIGNAVITLDSDEGAAITKQLSAGNGKVLINTNGIFTYGGGNSEVFAISSSDSQSWGNFTLDTGDILFGSNVSGSAAILWDLSSGKFGFYGNAGANPQVEIGTDGSLLAGAGAIKINETGLNYYGSGTAENNRKIRWYDTSDGDRLIGNIYSDYGGGLGVTWVTNWKNTGDPWTHSTVILAALDNASGKDIRLWVRTEYSDIYSFFPFTTGANFALNSVAEPSTRTGYAQIYVDQVDGDLKVKFRNGTVKTIATN
jgi:hypothetical protein